WPRCTSSDNKTPCWIPDILRRCAPQNDIQQNHVVRLLMFCRIDFEGFRTVMPALRLRSGQAPAGIQGEHAAASGYSAWIPAFAGMTQHSSTPQNHCDRLLGTMRGFPLYSSLHLR